ncbi:transglycosylase SLT domain-containing protein [Marinoscillum sp. MHG1-6]|uniref:transglycosylase SLT domain-containing protein n=1 Tax=Marinoscillum sp. MHG1-6 TaxID=2959627 RepID=UPI0021577C1B|nr:transporter substrate-binding domain-containing protein [Marinoscillum sp. MHG1-6]
MTYRTILKPLFLVLIFSLLVLSCHKPSSDGDAKAEASQAGDEEILDFKQLIKKSKKFVADLDEVMRRDTLKAITTYSSTSYFLYRGQPMGYEYELTRKLADHLGVELEMIIAKDINDIFKMLIEGEGDIITYNLTVTNNRRQYVDFTLPLNFTHQVLVQKKPDNWRDMKIHEIENELVRNPLQMIDLPIYVRKNSSYTERLLNLQDELGGKIDINYVDGDLSTDEIIKKVSRGEIPYTIADFNIANINAAYYQNIDIKTPVGIMQQLAWSVRKTSPDLKKKVNDWLEVQRKETDFYVIYNKYFKNRRAFTTRVKSDLYSKEGSRISEYDELIKDAAKSINWDWRFLASLIYQESGFEPSEESWVGAEGLMQIMPETAKGYGFVNIKDPKTNLKAGIAHLTYLDTYWKEHIPDSLERVKFILASYNAGQNHVQDARRLAEKMGYNSQIWFDNVDKCLLLKSQKEYFNDEVVQYGYCRGEEPVSYVKEIMDRFRYYVEFIPDTKDAVTS